MEGPYETWTDKFKRKFKENPWVPLGCLATTGALFMASVKMRRGKSSDMQYWLRARVVLQGATVLALVGGTMVFQAQKSSQVTDSGTSSLANSSPPSPSSKVSNTGLVGDVPTNEATAEQKKEREKTEFEARLKGAEIAHAQEQAFLSHTPPNFPAAGSVPTTDMQSTEQTTPPATGDSKSKSSWMRWFWGSGGSDKSS